MRELVKNTCAQDTNLQKLLEVKTQQDFITVIQAYPGLLAHYQNMDDTGYLQGGINITRPNLLCIFAIQNKPIPLQCLAQYNVDGLKYQLKEVRDCAYYRGRDDDRLITKYAKKLYNDGKRQYNPMLNSKGRSDDTQNRLRNKAYGGLIHYTEQARVLNNRFYTIGYADNATDDLKDVIDFANLVIPNFVTNHFLSVYYDEYVSAIKNGFDNVLPYIEARIERKLPGSLSAVISANNYQAYESAARYCSLTTLQYMERFFPDSLDSVIASFDYNIVKSALEANREQAVEYLCYHGQKVLRLAWPEQQQHFYFKALVYGNNHVIQSLYNYVLPKGFANTKSQSFYKDVFKAKITSGQLEHHMSFLEDRLSHLFQASVSESDQQWIKGLYEEACRQGSYIGVHYLSENFSDILQNLSLQVLYSEALSNFWDASILDQIATYVPDDQIQFTLMQHNTAQLYIRYALNAQLEKLFSHIETHMPPEQGIADLVKANNWSLYHDLQNKLESAKNMRVLHAHYKNMQNLNRHEKVIETVRNYYETSRHNCFIKNDVVSKLQKFVNVHKLERERNNTSAHASTTSLSQSNIHNTNLPESEHDLQRASLQNTCS